MRLKRFLVWVSLCILGLCSPSYTREAPEVPVRAIWVDAWHNGLYTPQQCDEMLAWCNRNGINTLIVEVRKAGDAYYNSRLEPHGRDEITGQWIDRRFDPLAHILKRARKIDGMRVEAWIVANRIWVGKNDPPDTKPPHVLRVHPDWALLNRDGLSRDQNERPSVYLDPSNPSVRAYTAQIAADIAKRYRVDAIHLDYIRYPGNQWGYGDRSLRRYWRDTGRSGIPEATDALFTRWRAAQVTRMVREVRDAIERARPRIELTAATVTWGSPSPDGYLATPGYTSAAQDWPSWCDAGLLDRVYIMHYKREHVPDQAQDFRAWFPWLRTHQESGKTQVIIGLGAYMNDIQATVAQARDTLRAGFDGYCLFSYAQTDRSQQSRDRLGEALRGLHEGR